MELEFIMLCFLLFSLLWQSSNSSFNEADALLEFKKNINDTQDSLRDWNSANKSSMCTWTGISCDLSTGSHVVSIHLTALLLEGSITPSIGRLSHLTSLNLTRNYYMTGAIPYELTNCSSLEVLDLSYNLFAGPIPDYLGRLPNLRYLSLRWNYYEKEIPSSLANCSQLQVLDLSRNQLSGRLPESLGQLGLLLNFSVADNLYIQGSIPRSFSNCSSMVGLRLRNNMLSGEVPAELLQLPSLVTLGISQNQFSAVESGSYHLSRIVEFNLTDNLFNISMKNLIKGIQQMKYLQILALGEFQQQFYGEIPASLLSMSSLVSLDLAKNSFSSIPPDWTYTRAKNLQYLDIRFNEFKSLPSHAFELLSSIKVLRLGNNELTSIPAELFTQENCSIEALDMSNNNISGIVPVSLGNCPSLKGLDFSQNKISGQLPQSIAQLPNLTYFVVSKNMLTGIVPPQIGLLEKLNYLDLSWNNFSGTLWTDYKSNSAMQQFDVSHNSLTGQIPHGMSNMTRLVRLDLSHNRLSGLIPQDLGRCSFLQQLDLSSNRLNGTLPTVLQNLTKLAVLNVGMNELGGQIDIDFGTIKNLVILQLGQNLFTGQIPSSLRNISLQRHQVQVTSQTRRHDFFLKSLCSGMQAVDLRENKFTGTIPDFFCKWTCLMVLSLAMNNLDGAIPECITNVTNLQVIDFSSNKLTGTLPKNMDTMPGFQNTNVSVQALGMVSKTPEWYNFGTGLFDFGITLRGAYITSSNLIDSFTFLDVSNNRLQGSIPPELVKLVGLMYLNLSSNLMSGNIPSGLSNLAILESLDLSRNRFEGRIPEDISTMHMSSFSVAYNNLSGHIPSGNNLNTRFPEAFQGNPGLCGFPLATCILNISETISPVQDNGVDHGRFNIWGLCCSAVPTFIATFYLTVFTDTCCQKIKVATAKIYRIRTGRVIQNNDSSLVMPENTTLQHLNIKLSSSSVVNCDYIINIMCVLWLKCKVYSILAIGFKIQWPILILAR